MRRLKEHCRCYYSNKRMHFHRSRQPLAVAVNAKCGLVSMATRGKETFPFLLSDAQRAWKYP